MTIEKLYGIKFFKKNLSNKIYYGMSSINTLLDQLITDDQTATDINDTLDTVNALLNGTINQMDYSSNSLNTIVANAQTTLIYDHPDYDSSSPNFSLPTSDFKLIVEAWKNYITKNQDLSDKKS